MSNTTTTTVSASAVRAWGTENGHAVKMGRGRLSHALVTAYNEAHPEAQYVSSANAPASDVRVESVPAKVSASDVRLWAIVEGGYADRVKMTRGKLPQDVIDAFNRGRKGSQRYTGNMGATVKISTKIVGENGKVRPYTRHALTSEVRAWAIEHGYADMTPGRMDRETYGAYALAHVGK